MSIARPHRFTSSYGFHSKGVSYNSTYKRLPNGGEVGGIVDNFLTDYSYRKVPNSQPFVNGWRQPTEWSMTSHRSWAGSHDYETKYYGSLYRVVGDGPRPQGMPAPKRAYDIASGYPILPIGLSERTRTKALNNIKNQKIDLSAVFGEANETLGTLADTIRRLAEAYRAARNGNWAKAGEALGYKGWKTVPNGWLTYYYGFLPIMNDIYGLQEQLKTPFREEGFLIRSSAEETDERSAAEAVGTHGANVKVSGFFRHICRVVYYLRVTDSKLLAASQLGLANPYSMLWEITTLSFVIDWFLPIGSFLQSLSAHYGTAFVGGFEDRITTYNVNVTGNWGNFQKGSKENYRSELLAFRRAPLTSTIPPNLFFLGTGLSNLPRAFSAAALLVNMRR